MLRPKGVKQLKRVLKEETEVVREEGMKIKRWRQIRGKSQIVMMRRRVKELLV